MQFFIKGEKKVRPGIYGRYEDVTPAAEAELIKVCACTIRSNWGPLDEVVNVTQQTNLEQIFGSGDTVSVIKEILAGNCQLVKVVRLGEDSDDLKAKLSIKNTAEEDVLKLTLKHPGSREFNATIQTVLGDASKKELIFYEDKNRLYSVKFDAATKDKTDVDEIAALLAVEESDYNPWFTIEKESDTSSGVIKNFTQEPITGGKDPFTNDGPSSTDYANACSLLETDVWDVLCLDTNDPEIHIQTKAFIDRIYNEGSLVMAVFGVPSGGSFSEKCTKAEEFNSHNIVYVGGSAKMPGDTETTFHGYLAAARVAGMMCGFDSSQTLTRKAIIGAVDVGEELSNEKYIDATKSGMLLFSKNRNGDVRIENGITTLNKPGNTPEGTEDAGWKKIKRVMIRHELMNRIDIALDYQISNSVQDVLMDTDGVASIRSTILRVIQEMQNERNLHGGAAEVSFNASASGPDSAAFTIAVDDIDSMEKIYLTYCYRYERTEGEV